MFHHKKIAVIILNYNNFEDTLLCAESLLAGTCPPTWLILVDNASTNNSLYWLKCWANGKLDAILPGLGAHKITPKPIPFTLIDADSPTPVATGGSIFIRTMSSNRGYAAGNNAGIVCALHLGADAVWILNNDTIVDEKALPHMRDTLFSQQRPGLCGSLVRYMNGLVQCTGGGSMNKWTGLSKLAGNGLSVQEVLQREAESVCHDLDFIYGASVMASREFIEKVGLLDERYFLYSEEQDWAFRSQKLFDFAYAHQAMVFHKEGGSTGFSCRGMTLRSLFYLTRSRLLLTWKHTPYSIPIVCLGILFAALRMMYRRIVLKPGATSRASFP